MYQPPTAVCNAKVRLNFQYSSENELKIGGRWVIFANFEPLECLADAVNFLTFRAVTFL